MACIHFDHVAFFVHIRIWRMQKKEYAEYIISSHENFILSLPISAIKLKIFQTTYFPIVTTFIPSSLAFHTLDNS